MTGAADEAMERDGAGQRRRPGLLLGGFAPLVVALVLFVLMVLLSPSVAPEREVVQPGDPTATTVEDEP